MDFNVDVHVRTSGKEQIDALEKQINALKSEKITIGVDVDSGNLNSNSSKAKNINKQLQRTFDNSIKNVSFNSNTFYKEYFDKAKKDIEEAKKVNKSFEKEINNINTDGINKDAIKAAKARASAEVKAEQEYIKEQKRLSKIRESESDLYYNSKRDAYQSIGKKSDIQKQMSAYYKELEIQSAKQAEEYSKIITKTRDKVINGSYDAKSSSMFAKLGVYGEQDNNLLNIARQQETIYNNTLSKLKNHFDSSNSFSLNDEEVVKSFTSMTLAAERFENVMTQVRNTQSKPLDVGVAERSANTVKKYYDENSKAVKKYGVELKDLENRYRQASTVADKSKIDNDFKNLKASISAEGLTGKSRLEELGRGFKQIGQFAYTYGAVQRVSDLIVNSVGELKEIDSVLTEISKTSDLTDKQIKQLGKDSFESASKYGRTAKDYLIGVQEMSRSGFYGKQGEELAELSILGQAAGDMTSDVSNSYLLATNAAYNYAGSVEKLNTVLDGQNMITNRNSVNMTDMAEATSKAASMASQTGVKINELSAVIGTAVARTKQEGNVIGTSLKSLFVNLQDTSNEKIVNTFKELGISQVKYVNGSKQLKTPIELLKELSVAYNNLPEGSTLKADVLRNIGQKRQANVLAAILGGMSSGDYDKMLNDYSQGKGSAAIEAAKSADNWEGNLNKLSNAWTSFVNNFTDTDLIIGATKSLTSFVGVLDTLTSNPLLTAGTFGSGLGIIQFFKNLDEPTNHRVFRLKISYINTAGLADIRIKHNGVLYQMAEHGEFLILFLSP